MELRYVEMPKMAAALDKNDKLQLWSKLLSAKTLKDVDKLKGLGVDIMSKATVKILELTEDERLRQIARAREDARVIERLVANANWRRGMAEGEVIGEARGEARGKAIGKAIGEAKAIQRFLDSGIPLAAVAEAYGRSEAEIQEMLERVSDLQSTSDNNTML
jgi:hypothetical protein